VYSGIEMTAKLRLAIEMLRRYRCSLGSEYQAVIDRSLRSHYDRLARQYCDEGQLAVELIGEDLLLSLLNPEECGDDDEEACGCGDDEAGPEGHLGSFIE
jgi:hypothetical protein